LTPMFERKLLQNPATFSDLQACAKYHSEVFFAKIAEETDCEYCGLMAMHWKRCERGVERFGD